MTVLHTNISSTIATNAINRFDRDQSVAMERLSTGLRINAAQDDAAGLAVSERMKTQVTGLEMAARNVNDAISMVETVEGASVEIANNLQRMRELAVQAASGTLTGSDRAALDLEFGQLFLEMQRIATQTTWNTMTLMDGDTAAGAVPAVALNSSQVTIQVGRNENQTMTLNFRSWDPRAAVKATTIMQTVNPVTGAAIAPAAALVTGAAGTVTTASRPGYDALGNDNHGIKTAANLSAQDTETQAYGAAVLFVGNGAIGAGVDDARINILSEANAGFALTNLDKAITAVATERARYGSYINRLEHTFDSHTHVAQHHAQSQSVVADAEYAHETSALAKQAILQQAGTAILAQANTMKEHTLNLLS